LACLLASVVESGQSQAAAVLKRAPDECVGDAWLVGGSRTQIGYSLRCDQPMNAIHLAVIMTAKQRKGNEGQFLRTFWAHLRKKSSDLANSGACEGGGVADGVLDCILGASEPATWYGRMTVPPDQRCHRKVRIWQYLSPSSDGGEVRPPALYWYEP